MLDILKDFVDWFWCWILDTIFAILDILVDSLLQYVPQLQDNQDFAQGLDVFYSYLAIAGTFFPLVEFIALYGIVKTLEIAVLVFRLIWRTVPGAG